MLGRSAPPAPSSSLFCSQQLCLPSSSPSLDLGEAEADALLAAVMLGVCFDPDAALGSLLPRPQVC